MKYIFYLYLLIIQINSISAQAKRPTIMVVPSKNWCFQNGYMITYDNQGVKEQVPDWGRALIENSDIGNVITKINGLMQDRGFPLDNLSSVLDAVKQSNAEMAVMTSKNSGSGVAENDYDRLMNTVKADIFIQIGWTTTTKGFNKEIQINMEALDSYTNESVASANPPGSPSSTASIPVMLSEAVLSVIDNFNARLQSYFDDLFANGRKITIVMNKFDSWDGDFESEYTIEGESKELSEILDNWVAKNTVSGRYNTTVSRENMIKFEKVRIPMYDAKGKAIDAKDYARDIVKYLKGEPFKLTSKLVSKGLGQAWIIVGDK